MIEAEAMRSEVVTEQCRLYTHAHIT